MNQNSRLLTILATGGGALILTYAAARFFFRDRRRSNEIDKINKPNDASRKNRENSGNKKDAPTAPPELRLDPTLEFVTKEDLARAQIISAFAGSSSASFDDSESISEERLVDELPEEEEEDEEEDETLEGEEDDDGFEGSSSRYDYEDDPLAERSTLDISLPNIPPEGAASILSPTEAEVLVDYLAGGSLHRRTQCLVSIANAAVFSANQYLLRRAGCIPVLNDLVLNDDKTVSIQATKALTNLAVNEENQEYMDETVGILVNVVGEYLNAADPERRRRFLDAEFCALQTLTNLSVTDKFNSLMVPLLPGLLENVDNCDIFEAESGGPSTSSILTQTWKILVNVSADAKMLPHLLTCRAPETFLEYLSDVSRKSESSNALRICYFLANIMDRLNKDNFPFPSTAVSGGGGGASAMMFSDDSLYSLLCREDRSSRLRTLLLELTRHADDNIRQQSTRLYTALFLFWGRRMSQGEGRKSSPI